ncbi:ulp1 protease family, C-terminal catalytic domain-containing protein [Tanacetum coccineum]
MNFIPMASLDDDDCQIIPLKYWAEDTSPMPRTRKIYTKGYVTQPNTNVDYPHSHEITVEPWIEDLSRPPNCQETKVILPLYFDNICSLPALTTHIFPWSITGHSVDRDFWLTLLGCKNRGWLSDKHLDIWCDLMWKFRQPGADWAIAGAYLCAYVMRADVAYWPANGIKYPVPWTEVDRFFIPINEPKTHYCLAVLHIMSGVITLYNSLGVPPIEKRDWWKEMRLAFQSVIPTYLDKCGVLKAKGLSLETYKVKFEVPANVPIQGKHTGDCGVWVCYFLYRLCQNFSINIDHEPTQVGLAYREHMLDYL